MRVYALVPYRTEGDYQFPQFPEGVEGEFVAHPGDFDWGLFQLWGNVSSENLAGLRVLSHELTRLLVSSERYPPALVISLEEVADEKSGQESYLERLESRLRANLKKQKTDPYILCEALVNEGGDVAQGFFYWLVGYDPKCEHVQFVSPYNFIYDEPRRVFDIDDESLARLPIVDVSV
ncbi:MAG: hypothetical protein AB7S38_43500 [Vulcanimicrobiota bacterium]